MKFIIHFTVDGEADSVVVEGDSIDIIRERAVLEVSRRGGVDAWSEEIP